MTMNDNYPAGAANDPCAPWNETEPEREELEVQLMFSLTIPQVVNVETQDLENYNYCEIKDEIIEQMEKPEDAIEAVIQCLETSTDRRAARLAEYLKTWEFEFEDYDYDY